jgi:hypothetical protein
LVFKTFFITGNTGLFFRHYNLSAAALPAAYLKPSHFINTAFTFFDVYQNKQWHYFG